MTKTISMEASSIIIDVTNKKLIIPDAVIKVTDKNIRGFNQFKVELGITDMQMRSLLAGVLKELEE